MGLIVAVALGVIALVAAAVVFLSSGDGDSSGGGELAAGEVFLEPVSFFPDDSFFGNLDLTPPPVPTGADVPVALDDVPSLPPADGTGRAARGDQVGLYGGSLDVGVCDVEQLIDFLTDPANADKAAAWAEVQGIEVDGIEDFIRGLTAVRLRFDTRVTNHGFRNGRANPIQSVLQAGTAVLVDERGVPRVKCNCGNPLAEPTPLTAPAGADVADVAANPEAAWPSLDIDLVVNVEPASGPQNDFIILDMGTGEPILRPAGTNGDEDIPADPGLLCDDLPGIPGCGGPTTTGGTTTTEGTTTTTSAGTTTTVELGTGDVQITLRWFSNADLDLAVTDPEGNRIDFTNRESPTGGRLDVDSNIDCEPEGSVENIFWPPGGAPAGPYTVEVTGFTVGGDCGGGDYELTIRVAGQPDIVHTGSVGEGETDTYTFRVG